MYIRKEQKNKCHAIIHGASASTAAVGAGLAQIPLSDTVLITPIQITMIVSLGAVLDIKLTQSAASAILGTVATSTIGRGVSQVFFGWIPGVGNAINASTAAAITEAVGWAAVKYFESISEEEIKKYNSAKEEGRQKAKAEFDIEIKKMKEKVAKVLETLEQYEQLENFIMGAFSIGIAAANIDGNISNEERKTLELVTVGLSYNILPYGIVSKISQLFYEKPTFNDAMKIIKNVDKIHWSVFNDVVEAIVSIDDSDSDEKSAFRTAWNKVYRSA